MNSIVSNLLTSVKVSREENSKYNEFFNTETSDVNETLDSIQQEHVTSADAIEYEENFEKHLQELKKTSRKINRPINQFSIAMKREINGFMREGRRQNFSPQPIGDSRKSIQQHLVSVFTHRDHLTAEKLESTGYSSKFLQKFSSPKGVSPFRNSKNSPSQNFLIGKSPQLNQTLTLSPTYSTSKSNKNSSNRPNAFRSRKSRYGSVVHNSTFRQTSNSPSQEQQWQDLDPIFDKTRKII